MSAEYEACIRNLNNLSQIRSSAEKKPFIKTEALDSVVPPKLILTDVFQRLQLKEKNIEVFTPATDDDISSFSNNVKLIDSEG